MYPIAVQNNQFDIQVHPSSCSLCLHLKVNGIMFLQCQCVALCSCVSVLLCVSVVRGIKRPIPSADLGTKIVESHAVLQTIIPFKRKVSGLGYWRSWTVSEGVVSISTKQISMLTIQHCLLYTPPAPALDRKIATIKDHTIIHTVSTFSFVVCLLHLLSRFLFFVDDFYPPPDPNNPCAHMASYTLVASAPCSPEYYHCVDGQIDHTNSCSWGWVFNELSRWCDDYENTPSCHVSN